MRSRRASRPWRSNGTSNRPGPWPREATTGPRNASSGGCPCGPSTSVGSGSSRRAWTRRNPASGTPWKGAGTSEMRRRCLRTPARPSPSRSTTRSGPCPPRRSRRRTPSASMPGPRRSSSGRAPTWKRPGGTASTSRKRGSSSHRRGTPSGRACTRTSRSSPRRPGTASARRLVSQARHRAESTRETHFRTIMERSLQIILANATRGLDPVVARQLLREVDDAMTLGKAVDMQALIDQRMEDQDAQTEGKLNERVLRARDDIVALRQAGQTDTVALEGKLADAAIAMQEGRYLQSDALLDSIEHDISATRESLRSTAAEILGQARGEVARARADGIPIDAADQMLKDAETSYSEARYGDTIYAGKACISEVEELAQANADSKRQSVAEQTRIKLERMEGIHRRMEVVRSDITDLVAQNLDLARAATTLSAPEQAIERGSLDEADHLVASAEGIVEGVKVTLNGQATDALQRTRKAVEVADGEGIEVDEFRTAVAQAETDLKAGRPGAVLQAIGQIDRLVSERRRTRQQEEQRRALEMARTAATKFISVKKLIEDLRKADIDITGAEEGLRAAERALEKRNFDDVDAILTTLDATAKELMDELVAAAKNLIGRAERKSK